MILAYEKRCSDLMMLIQKQERDIAFKDEEIKSVKNIARDVAQKLDPVKQMEVEFQKILNSKDQVILGKEDEIHGLFKVIEDHKLQIQELKATIDMMEGEQYGKVDERLDWEAKIDKKEQIIYNLQEEVVKLKDDLVGKAEAISALSLTLIEKAQDNAKLSEMVTEIKQHHINSSVLG